MFKGVDQCIFWALYGLHPNFVVLALTLLNYIYILLPIISCCAIIKEIGRFLKLMGENKEK